MLVGILLKTAECRVFEARLLAFYPYIISSKKSIEMLEKGTIW